MKIKSLVPWYGSKRTLAPRICKQFGPHTTYVEPFAGSLAVLLAKEPARHEVVSDLHADLVNLLRVLCDERSAKALYSMLNGVTYCEALYVEALERLKDLPQDAPSRDGSLLRARDYFWVSWMGRNGLCGTDKELPFARRMTASGGAGPKRWASALESIPDWHERLKNVEFHQRDGFETIAKTPDAKDVVLYVDPPYVAKEAKYLHDFADADHERLAALLKRFRCARVIVSYYQCEATDRLYAGWSRVDYFGKKAMSNTANAETERSNAQECVYINGEVLPEV